MTISVTRKARFCAGHRYWRADWTPEKNHEVFGACANEHGHGHNYTLEVTVRGPVDPRTGMVINLTDLDRLIQQHVIERIDHRNLNVDIPELAGRIPTTEVLADFIWNALEGRLPVGELDEVRVYEADDLWSARRRPS
jgi:6-pyruvoyltetrahydropterin/6-carboxytetrahydropterin synthase